MKKIKILSVVLATLIIMPCTAYAKEDISEGFEIVSQAEKYYKTVTNKMVNALIPYFDIDYKHIIVCHDKHLIKGDYLIDDNPKNLEKSMTITFLMDAPYNQDADVKSYDFRVKSIGEALDIMEEIKEMRFSE